MPQFHYFIVHFILLSVKQFCNTFPYFYLIYTKLLQKTRKKPLSSFLFFVYLARKRNPFFIYYIWKRNKKGRNRLVTPVFIVL